ncbi:MAG: beta-lactamase family protein [Woeseiaceae bacterium]|nr:beta-lactamase family protein [Woeseiaceae bacterium]
MPRTVKHLPYFRLADERYRDITIRQMLNHTAGMPDVEDYGWDQPQFDDDAAERYVRSMSSEQLLWARGSNWQYSNMAFDALGNLIAKVSGVRFEEYIRIKILDPIGMIDSSFQSSIGIWICHRLGRRSRRGWYGHHRHDTAKCCVRILIWIEAMYRAGRLRSSRRYPAESGDGNPAPPQKSICRQAHTRRLIRLGSTH